MELGFYSIHMQDIVYGCSLIILVQVFYVIRVRDLLLCLIYDQNAVYSLIFLRDLGVLRVNITMFGFLH